jgi:hypothetical protein
VTGKTKAEEEAGLSVWAVLVGRRFRIARWDRQKGTQKIRGDVDLKKAKILLTERHE